ncbi:MAG: acetyl-CoA carboxylase biotin carboxyl carrier protein subunit [Clostridia bacterium]|nr:acetyl-CoA carboxylase biotin carboxyl carrier protein subunit [Clostridia bacterium]
MKRYNVTVNGKTYDVTVEEISAGAAAPAAPATPAAPAVAPVAAAPAAPANGTKVNAPMPGTVLKTNVAVGDKVEKGQVVCVLEAMKMENDITAPTAGTVSFIVAKGTSVKTGDALVVLA